MPHKPLCQYSASQSVAIQEPLEQAVALEQPFIGSFGVNERDSQSRPVVCRYKQAFQQPYAATAAINFHRSYLSMVTTSLCAAYLNSIPRIILLHKLLLHTICAACSEGEAPYQ